MIYTQETMPWKITLEADNIKLTYYKSTTTFLSYDETKFTTNIQSTREGKESNDRAYRKTGQMQILSKF